ncbi:hypothetical protein PFISCL1PPCAC_12174, partial [Pristionchus fissidentatus]
MNTSLSGCLTDEGSFEVIERRNGSIENANIPFGKEEEAEDAPLKVEDAVLFDQIYEELPSNGASMGTKNAEKAVKILRQRMSDLRSGVKIQNEDRMNLLAETAKTMRDQQQRCGEQLKLVVDEVVCLKKTINAHFGEKNDGHKDEPSQNSILRTITCRKGVDGKIGCRVEDDSDGDYPFVYDIYKTSPAYLAGLREGDRIVSVNGTVTFGATKGMIAALLSPVNEMLVVDEECVKYHKKCNADLPIDPE